MPTKTKPTAKRATTTTAPKFIGHEPGHEPTDPVADAIATAKFMASFMDGAGMVTETVPVSRPNRAGTTKVDLVFDERLHTPEHVRFWTPNAASLRVIADLVDDAGWTHDKFNVAASPVSYAPGKCYVFLFGMTGHWHGIPGWWRVCRSYITLSVTHALAAGYDVGPWVVNNTAYRPGYTWVMPVGVPGKSTSNAAVRNFADGPLRDIVERVRIEASGHAHGRTK